uniref:Putative ovule protein n=1 Tax=Solanum chacoense TaxID=4108 RepID=A0A0V0GSX2_SOLCH
MDISRLMVYVQQVEEEKLRDREEFKNKGLRQGTSSGSRRAMPTSHLSNRNRRDMLHHQLVHLHLRTRVSTMVRILELSLPILRAVWRKGVVSLLPAPSVVGTIQVCVVRDPLVVSIVARLGI